MTRRLIVAMALVAGAAAPARADRPVAFLPAKELPKNVTVFEPGKLTKEQREIVIEVTPGEAAATKVIEDKDPKAPSHLYILVGKVKYEDVDETAYLEMWSHFDDAMYFSRTLGEDKGPMQKIVGTSNWRDIALPFRSKPGMLPDKLVVNVVLPGKGKIWLTELRLKELQEADLMSAGDWWGERTAAWTGAIGGSTIGLIGGIIGTLCGAGVGRQLCQGLCFAVIGVCGLALVAGIAAVSLGQPYHVYYPLLLGGGLGVTVFGLNMPTIRKRFDAVELRRMAALDA
jgi:hypothetical protein